MQGFYKFAKTPDHEALKDKLHDEVKFLVDDAPALAVSINPNAPVNVIDLAVGYRASIISQAKNIIPLVNC